MKRLISILAFLISLSLMAGCSDGIFTTKEYRSYQSFAEHHQAGTEKQAIFNTLGWPDGYFDNQGNYQHISYAEREDFKSKLLDNSSAVWVYECHKWSDPADPYRLKITFDSEGKSTSAEMAVVPGG